MPAFLSANNPFTKKGRHQIVKTFLSSGPAANRYARPRDQTEEARFTGWRMGSLVSCVGVGIYVFTNTGLFIYALAVGHTSGGISTLFTGSCDKVRSLDLWLHVVINALGTILLGAGNYNMQCLGSPNRADIDIAHGKGIWLDIGVPSIRNLRHISWNRVILWLLILISTLPLHLFWNSTIFSTLQANDYAVMVVSQDFKDVTDLNCTMPAVNGLYVSYRNFTCSMYAAAELILS